MEATKLCALECFCSVVFWALVESLVDELAVVPPFPLRPVVRFFPVVGYFPCSARRWFPTCSCWWVSSPPGECAESLLVVLLFLSLLLLLSVEAFVLVSGWEFLSSMGPGLGFWLDVMDLLTVSVFGPFFSVFTCCELSAKWRDLRHLFSGICSKLSSTWRAFPEFLLLFAAPVPGGCQGEVLTQTALSSGAPGSLVGLLSQKVGGSEERVCSACSSLAVGACRPSGLGGAASANLCRGTATRSFSTRGKRGYTHHSMHTESAPLTYALRTTASRARHATAHLASLAHNPRRYVVSVARNAERRMSKRSTARVRGTCTTYNVRTNLCVHALGPVTHTALFTAHAHVVRCRAPFCLPSTSHRPPSLLRGFASRVPLYS